jgi:hypothetical protein
LATIFAELLLRCKKIGTPKGNFITNAAASLVSSSSPLPPSPPGEKTTTCEEEAGQARTGDGAGHPRWAGVEGQGQAYVVELKCLSFQSKEIDTL